MIDENGNLSDQFLDANVSWRRLMDVFPNALLIEYLGKVVFVNDECVRLFRATCDEELLGRSVSDLTIPEQKEQIKQFLETILTNLKNAPPVDAFLPRDGQNPIMVQLHAVPVRFEPVGNALFIWLHDLSDRQQAMEMKFRTENQFRNILDTAMDGIISIDQTQTIVVFNRAAEAIFGWRADEVLGQSIDRLIPTRYLATHRQHVEQFGNGEIPIRRMGVQRTVMAVRATGEEFPIEASISHTMIDGSRLYTVILRDVSEATRHRQQIEQQSQMLDRVSDAVSVVDRDDKIIFWNRGAERLFGWSVEEAIGQTASKLFYRGDFDESVALQMAGDGNSWSGELKKLTRSEKTVIVDHRRTRLQTDRGDDKGYICIDIDITTRKKQERLSHRSQRLESIGTLAGGIAHDLNNVLTPILMGAKLLESERPNIDRRGLLTTMLASAQRGAALIQQLLSFAGGVRGERRPVHIDQIINETRGLLEHTFPKSILINSVVASDCPAVVGDSTELTQVLMNLSINARDAMPHGGSLLIEAEATHLNGNAQRMHPLAKPGPYLVVSVTDTGSGMTHEVLDRIFDPFFTTKEFGRGTGLGLATVQGIVTSYGGFVLVYSEMGRGSKFSIFLPATVDDSESTSAPISLATEVKMEGLVLIVDDEPTIREMTTAFLVACGYRVMTAEDGNAAIATFTRHRDEVSVVLLDMMMPGMDGLQTLDRLLQIDPKVKVIACSGLRTAHRETEVLERGAKQFLPKPYSDQQLLHALSNAIGTHS